MQGALSDYAGNHGDLTPGATGAPTDFYFGGNGTGVIISVRPDCKSDKAIAPSDRIRMASVTDGTASTFLFGEKFVPLDRLGQFPEDSPAYDGDHLPASSRLAGPGLRLANGPGDVLADMFSFGSWHPAGVHFALVDGSVRLLTADSRTNTSAGLSVPCAQKAGRPFRRGIPFGILSKSSAIGTGPAPPLATPVPLLFGDIEIHAIDIRQIAQECVLPIGYCEERFNVHFQIPIVLEVAAVHGYRNGNR